MKEKRPYETTNIRALISVVYGVTGILTVLAGLGVGITGCVEHSRTGGEEDLIMLIIGFTIAAVSPFLLQISYRLTLAPFDIIDLLRERKNLDNNTENSQLPRK